MSLPAITSDQFSSWINISDNRFSNLQDYIDTFYPEFARRIIGDSAYLDAKNNVKSKWDDLFNGVEYIDDDGNNVINDGLIESIRKFIYFEFVRDDFSSTQTGKSQPLNENSTRVVAAPLGSIVTSRWNSGERALCESVAPFLNTFSEISEPITGFVDNADNTYTIQLASTLYLDDGDSVAIGGVEYVISGIVENVSFVIDAGSIGLSFSGDATWEPYELVAFNTVGIVGI